MSSLETLMIVCIVVTALAVLIQMVVLVALYGGIRKSSSRMETLAHVLAQLEAQALPALETVQSMLQEYRPKIETVLNNAAETSTIVKEEVVRLDTQVVEVSERLRLQAIRVDELVSHTLDRIENATALVHQSVVSPVRQASGVLQGVTTGLATLFHKGPYARAKRGAGVPKDDMFV
jgi:hypothetical protein